MAMDLKKIISKYKSDPSRLMDILNDVQAAEGCISPEVSERIAKGLKLSRADVDQTVSFYHFFSTTPRGKYTVYLNNSAVAEMMGRAAVAEAFEKAAGCRFGEVSKDGKIGLYTTACIGMNDQEPAAIINNVVFTSLTPQKAKNLVSAMKAGASVKAMVTKTGDGSMVSEYDRAFLADIVLDH